MVGISFPPICVLLGVSASLVALAVQMTRPKINKQRFIAWLHVSLSISPMSAFVFVTFLVSDNGAICSQWQSIINNVRKQSKIRTKWFASTVALCLGYTADTWCTHKFIWECCWESATLIIWCLSLPLYSIHQRYCICIEQILVVNCWLRFVSFRFEAHALLVFYFICYTGSFSLSLCLSLYPSILLIFHDDRFIRKRKNWLGWYWFGWLNEIKFIETISLAIHQWWSFCTLLDGSMMENFTDSTKKLRWTLEKFQSNFRKFYSLMNIMLCFKSIDSCKTYQKRQAFLDHDSCGTCQTQRNFLKWK